MILNQDLPHGNNSSWTSLARSLVAVDPRLYGLHVEAIGAQEAVQVLDGERRGHDAEAEHELVLHDPLHEYAAQRRRLDCAVGVAPREVYSVVHVLLSCYEKKETPTRSFYFLKQDEERGTFFGYEPS